MHRLVGEQCRNQHQHGVAEVHGGLFPKYQLFLLLSPSGVFYILQYYWFDVHFVRFFFFTNHNALYRTYRCP